MEVVIKAHYEDMEPYSITAPSPEKIGGVYALLDLRLINHRTDRPERIIGCWVELRRHHLLLWHRTLAKIPVLTNSPTDWELKYPIKDIHLEPMGKPQDYVINILGDLQGFAMPKRSELVLVFKMVGPVRKYICEVTDVLYNPQLGEGNGNREKAG